jgi:extracellular factor (EF) 3-hydroxypalmitic acid methyl ester biosynthesis protein
MRGHRKQANSNMHDFVVNSQSRSQLDHLLSELNGFVERGGPAEHEYNSLSLLFDRLQAFIGPQNDAKLLEFMQHTPVFNTTETNQGFAYLRPHGYCGDFEIIERIYSKRTSSDPALRRWDEYFHECAGTRAVRARKDYCLNLFEKTIGSGKAHKRILNVASGPCRDVYEFLNRATDNCVRSVSIHCIDQDTNAIEHARSLLAPFSNQVSFENRNIFRSRLGREYDLIWSAGLFDYLEDRLFVRLLVKLSAAVTPGGELVIGNFSHRNVNRSYMEFARWVLIHRDEDELLRLAKEARLDGFSVRIDQEPHGVNLFMHLRNSADAIAKV